MKIIKPDDPPEERYWCDACGEVDPITKKHKGFMCKVMDWVNSLVGNCPHYRSEIIYESVRCTIERCKDCGKLITYYPHDGF